MNSSPSDPPSTGPENQSEGLFERVGNVVGDLVTGATIPAPVRKNALKALGQLFTAAVDVPVAYLEGVAAEKRAESQARIQILSTGGAQIAEQMNVGPEFARAAVQKYGQRIVREQTNLNKISEVAVKQLQVESADGDASAQGETEAPTISDDWLNSFEREASQKSTEEMQFLFGRILAGEVQRPSSFSLKTVRLVGQLDENTAKLFRTLCSLSVALLVQGKFLDARVLVLEGNAASNSLQDYGLTFDMLNVLHEHGLIISDYNSYMNYSMCVAQNGLISLPLRFQNNHWGLISPTPRPVDQELRLNGVALSRSGRELLNIVDVEPNERYAAALSAFFERQGLTMVNSTKPGFRPTKSASGENLLEVVPSRVL